MLYILRVSDTAPERLNGKKFRDLLYSKLVSLFELLSLTRLVLHEQQYIADCKDEGNTLKPYIPEKKTVVLCA